MGTKLLTFFKITFEQWKDKLKAFFTSTKTVGIGNIHWWENKEY